MRTTREEHARRAALVEALFRDQGLSLTHREVNEHLVEQTGLAMAPANISKIWCRMRDDKRGRDMSPRLRAALTEVERKMAADPAIRSVYLVKEDGEVLVSITWR